MKLPRDGEAVSGIKIESLWKVNELMLSVKR